MLWNIVLLHNPVVTPQSTNSSSLHQRENSSLDQNPEKVAQLRTTLAYQNEVLQGFQAQLVKLRAANVTHYIQSLPSRRHDKVRMALPEKFD